MEIKYRTQFPELLEHLGLKGDAVECGVAEGRLSEVLIKHPTIEKLYLIDAWEHLDQSGDGGYPQEWHSNNWKEAHERVDPWKEKAVFLKGLSHQMIKEIPNDSLIFAYVDADHSFNGCFNDLIGVYAKIKSGGVISCHDVNNPSYGVKKALYMFLLQEGYDTKDVHFTEENGDLMMVSAWFIKK